MNYGDGYMLIDLSTKEIRNVEYDYLYSSFEILKKVFKYCIYHTNLDKHGTSLLIRTDDTNKLTISCVNSGAGIHHFKKLLERDRDYVLPFKTFVISDNIKEDHYVFTKISTILLVPYFYEQIQDNLLYIFPFTRVKHVVADETRNIYIYTLDELFCNIMFKIINLFPIVDEISNFLEKIGFDIEYTDVVDYTKQNLCTDLNLKKLVDNKYILKSLTRINIDNTDSYYEIIMNVLMNFTQDKTLIDKDLFEHSNLKLNENIKDNIILHQNNGKLFIKEQQSGSCSWFSLYWPLVFYNIYNDNIPEYYSFIQRINDFFYKKLQQIFTVESFKMNIDNVVMMKILYQKFFDLNLIHGKKIFDNDDLIYGVPIKIKYTDDYQKVKVDMPLLKYITDLQNNTENECGYCYNDILTYFFNIFIKICTKPNVFHIFAYELYLYGLFIKKELFIKNDINQFDTIILAGKEYTENNELFQEYVNHDNLKEYDEHEKNIKEIRYNILCLNNLIDNGNNEIMINFRVLQECKHIIYYYNKRYPDKKQKPDKNYILNFCNFVSKLMIFIDIYNGIYKLCLYYSNIIKKLIYFLNKSTTCTIDVIDHILPKNSLSDIFIDINYRKITKYDNLLFPVKPIYGMEKINTYTRSYDDYNNLLIFLYKNPNYIYQSFNKEKYIIDDCHFI